MAEMNGVRLTYELPEPICQYCNRKSYIWEELNDGWNEHQVWVYCEQCNAETFIQITNWR